MLKDSSQILLMSIPNALADVIQMIMNPNALQELQTSFETETNESIVQTLLTMIQMYVTSPLIQLIIQPTQVNYLLDSINIGLVTMGYMMHYKQITRDELKNYIYYARLSPTGQLFRSNYHPLRLRELMNADEIPPSFQNLYNDRDYIPNIVSVWDRSGDNSLLLLSFQKVNMSTSSVNETVIGEDSTGAGTETVPFELADSLLSTLRDLLGGLSPDTDPGGSGSGSGSGSDSEPDSDDNGTDLD